MKCYGGVIRATRSSFATLRRGVGGKLVEAPVRYDGVDGVVVAYS
jgi:hypothetical protein